jgi:hypothetical protein
LIVYTGDQPLNALFIGFHSYEEFDREKSLTGYLLVRFDREKSLTGYLLVRVTN